MKALFDDAVKVAEPRYEMEPSLEDDISLFQSQLDIFFQNLVEYRAHLAHKHSEAAFDKAFYESCTDIEVVAISNYKMKILASRYRESQEGMLFWSSRIILK